jgi:hypothetical protein
LGLLLLLAAGCLFHRQRLSLPGIADGDEARVLFENLRARLNHHGFLAEHTAPGTAELWGNFVQTYSMVGLINSAIRLSKRWGTAC